MDRSERVELTVLCLVRDGEKILVEDRQRGGSWRGGVRWRTWCGFPSAC